MTGKEFELHIAQVETVLNKCRSQFKTKRHQETYNNLLALFNAVKLKYSNFDKVNLQFCRDHVLMKIYLGIEFLHYRKSNEVPKHLISCLEICLTEWIDSPKFYSIVFSHNSQHLQDFKTWTFYNTHLKDINDWTKKHLGVEYEHGLIQISQPRFFNHDFMSNIPCYHELGHFVESFYNIIFWVINNKIGFTYEFGTKKLTNDGNLDNKETAYIFFWLREHFCDLYAAQYLGNIMEESLKFVAENHGYGAQHPSTERRISVIDTFLNGSGTVNDQLIVETIKEATKAQTKRHGRETELLISRGKPLSNNPFKVNRIVKLEDKAEIHSLIVEGWKYFILSTDFVEPINRMEHLNKMIRGSIELTLMNEKYYSPKRLLSRWLN